MPRAKSRKSTSRSSRSYSRKTSGRSYTAKRSSGRRSTSRRTTSRVSARRAAAPVIRLEIVQSAAAPTDAITAGLAKQAGGPVLTPKAKAKF